MNLRRLRRPPRKTGDVKRRILAMGAVIVCLLGALSIRLWVLQVIRGDEYRRRSETNRIETQVIPGLRGKILDRHGRVLARNRPAFRLALIPRSVPNLAKTLQRLEAETGLDPLLARAAIGRGNPFKRIVVQQDISRRAVAHIMEHRWELPGALIQVGPLREYTRENLAAHLMGYLGEVGEEQLRKDKRYRPGDMVGKKGLEREHEKTLRGTHGKRWVEVDAFGREIKVIGERPAKRGKNLILTLSLDLQRKAETLLADQPGVLIATDPRNGDILALASNPRFDPNALSKGMDRPSWRALLRNPLRVLQDRATRGLYPPGSVFKIVMAGAALEEGVISPSDTQYCPGHLRFGGRTYRDWRPQGHGHVNLHRALTESCDVYFYQLGIKLGIDRIAEYARAFGLGRPTGLLARGEKAGIVASPQWKKAARGEPWYPGETLSASIGQGYHLVTPTQLAVLISAVANGGTLFRPRLVLRIEEDDGSLVQSFEPEARGHLPVSPRNLEIIRSALRGVVHDRRGTGFRARIPGIEVAGKTGTAQVVRLKHRKDSKEQLKGPRLHRDHAWFVAFAPYVEPTIAVVVLAEHAGVGGSRIAPLARELIAFHLQRENRSLSAEAKPAARSASARGAAQ